jgi:uncharacterized protein YbjQ (UPF0145 family)
MYPVNWTDFIFPIAIILFILISIVISIRNVIVEKKRFLPTTDFSSASNLIAVKSDHIGGYRILKILGSVRSQEYRNSEDAVDEVRYLAKQMGGNAVISLRVTRRSVQSLVNRNYIYGVHTTAGTAVLVEPL